MTEPPTIYRLTFRALSDTTSPTNRLKRLLKVALRTFSFRCVNIETISEGVRQDSAPSGASESENNLPE